MYLFVNTYLNQILGDPEFGTFIAPDVDVQQYADPNEKYKIKFPTGCKARFDELMPLNPNFQAVAQKIIDQRSQMSFEDQCTAKYYFDVFTIAESLKTKINKIVEIGVYTGGMSTILAGAIHNTHIHLDLVDLNKVFLRLTYERIRRLYPDVAARTRLFFGDMATYVKNVALNEPYSKNLIHHDGSHTFNEVVKDVASLYYVRDRVQGLIIQDTNLRAGNIESYVFVDAALYAVFNSDLHYYSIGSMYPITTNPAFQISDHGVYWVAEKPEGMYIPFEMQKFHYPHPMMELDRFLPKKIPEGMLASA